MNAPLDAWSVSVVVPTYNGTLYLNQALESVFAQTLRPAEVVVVDDASTDGTAELAEKLSTTSPIPLRVVRLAANSGGPSRPLNRGIPEARGPLIAVLDQDDQFAPHKLECQVSVLTQYPEVRAVGSFGAELETQHRRLQSEETEAALAAAAINEGVHWRFDKPAFFRALLQHGNVLMGYPGFLFRKEDWLAKGGADESLRISSDYDLLCWLALRGSIAVVPEVQYFRREHAGNLCKRDVDVYIDSLRVKARYLAQERWLLDDLKLAAELREEMFGLAYWLRQAGRPWQAMGYCRLYQKLWGYDHRTLWLMAKLLPQGLMRMVGYRMVGQRG